MSENNETNPSDSPAEITDLEDFRKRVGVVIEGIRPGLQMDGGDIKLVGVTETGQVQVSLYGACAGCPHAQATLKMGVERILKEEIPEVSEVVSIPA